jgi:hypothetical protein
MDNLPNTGLSVEVGRNPTVSRDCAASAHADVMVTLSVVVCLCHKNWQKQEIACGTSAFLYVGWS